MFQTFYSTKDENIHNANQLKELMNTNNAIDSNDEKDNETSRMVTLKIGKATKEYTTETLGSLQSTYNQGVDYLRLSIM